MYVSTRNAFDPKDVAVFKDRVLSRHENYNGIIKGFEILSNESVFRHDMSYHETCFHAVNAVVHYEIENGGRSLMDAWA